MTTMNFHLCIRDKVGNLSFFVKTDQAFHSQVRTSLTQEQGLAVQAHTNDSALPEKTDSQENS